MLDAVAESSIRSRILKVLNNPKHNPLRRQVAESSIRSRILKVAKKVGLRHRIVVAESSIRSRILKDVIAKCNQDVLDGCREFDPFEDTESSSEFHGCPRDLWLQRVRSVRGY